MYNKTKRIQNKKETEISYLSIDSNQFQIENNPLFSQIDINSDSLTGEYKNTKVKDNDIINLIKSKENVYSLYYYRPPISIKQDSVILYFVSGGWDYDESIYLVTKKKNIVIDYIVIGYRTGSVNGSGFDFYLKKTEYKDSKFISDFKEFYQTFSCPIDTITYHKKGKSRIWIDEKGKIYEDTLDIKYNYQILGKNPDCE